MHPDVSASAVPHRLLVWAGRAYIGGMAVISLATVFTLAGSTGPTAELDVRPSIPKDHTETEQLLEELLRSPQAGLQAPEAALRAPSGPRASPEVAVTADPLPSLREIHAPSAAGSSTVPRPPRAPTRR